MRVTPIDLGRQAGVLACIGAVGAAMPILSNAFGTRTMLLFSLTLGLTGITLLLPETSIPVAVSTVMFFALVRRIFPSPTPVSDAAAIFPFIVAAPLAFRGLRDHAPPSVVFYLGWSAATLLLNFSSPLVGVGGIANLAVPMTIGLSAAQVPNGLSLLRKSFAVTAGVASSYGLVQYFVAPSWDARWLRDAQFSSAGPIGTSGFRPFGTLPSPGALAVVAAVVVLLVVRPGSPVTGLTRAWVGSTCGLILLLGQVRSVWIATVAAVIISTMADRRRAGRTIVAVAFLSVIVILVVPGKTTLADRVKTLSNPSSDRSYTARTDLLRDTGSLASPFGRGLGAYSAGNRVEGGKSLDNGYLVVLAETGVIGVALLVWVLKTAAHNAKPRDYPFLAFTLIVNMAGFAIGGVAAIFLWSTCGLQRAASLEESLAPEMISELPT